MPLTSFATLIETDLRRLYASTFETHWLTPPDLPQLLEEDPAWSEAVLSYLERQTRKET